MILKVTHCRDIFNCCGFVNSFFHILTIFHKKSTTFRIYFFQCSINSSKYVHFWTLVLKTMLTLIKFPFQRYISYRHLNFNATFENGCYGDFPSFRKQEILRLLHYFAVCTKSFLEIIGPYKNVNQEFSLDSKKFYETQLQGLD